MRVAVVGGTGRVGRSTIEFLAKSGHDAFAVSRSTGVDLLTGEGLAAALAGADAVVDTTNTPVQDEAKIVEFFSTATGNLLAAAEQAGVGHHVLLSIVGVDRGQRVPHYEGKRAQERLVRAAGVPWTIVRATQFHDFAAMTAEWTERDGVATVAPLLVQPVDIGDLGQVLAEVAVDTPLRRHLDVAGPGTQDLVDMARRTFAARGRDIRLVPTWRGVFDLSMAGEVLLPDADPRLTPTSFEDWLDAGAR